MHIEKSINETKSKMLKKDKSQSFDIDATPQDENEVHLDEVLQSKRKQQNVETIEEEDMEAETTKN